MTYLTGKEGGRKTCLGEQVSEPTAITAFTGIVKIWKKKQKQGKLGKNVNFSFQTSLPLLNCIE